MKFFLWNLSKWTFFIIRVFWAGLKIFIFSQLLNVTLNTMFSENIGIDNHFEQIKKMGIFWLHIIAFSVENLAAGDISKTHIRSHFTGFCNFIDPYYFWKLMSFGEKNSKLINWFKSYTCSEILVIIRLFENRCSGLIILPKKVTFVHIFGLWKVSFGHTCCFLCFLRVLGTMRGFIGLYLP